MNTQYIIMEMTADSLKNSNALQMLWDTFKEFEANKYTAEGLREFQNYIEYTSMRRRLENSELMMWGCFHNGKAIGLIAGRDPGHISLLFVDKQYHRQGVARALYQKFVEHYSNCSEISVNSSLYAIEAYQRLGFVATDVEQQKNGIRFVPMKHKVR